jgi:hypothetical protein
VKAKKYILKAKAFTAPKLKKIKLPLIAMVLENYKAPIFW